MIFKFLKKIDFLYFQKKIDFFSNKILIFENFIFLKLDKKIHWIIKMCWMDWIINVYKWMDLIESIKLIFM